MQPDARDGHAVPAGLGTLPRRIDRLGELAYNLWWTWNPSAQRLFRRIDESSWELARHNPVNFLRNIKRPLLNAVANERSFLEQYDQVLATFDAYLAAEQTWFAGEHAELVRRPIAYFSSEYGLHESLPIYAGGLGVLSGDHLKQASDLGLPMVGVGFLYTRGYFRQRISEDGWQEALYELIDFNNLPVWPVTGRDAAPLTVSVHLPGRDVAARLWQVRLGRISLYLLDSNVEGNSEVDRELTSRLYTSELEQRLSQEIVLGIGGVRALRALGYNPTAWHLNEGHSAFALLERAREYVAAGRTFAEAIQRVRETTLFTTHTPVPAGNDEFPLWVVEKFFSGYWGELGLERDTFLDQGRNRQAWGETFSMPVLALRLSSRANAVSELHGHVARRMWHALWPDLDESQVPISHITNGIHSATWLARQMGALFDRHLPEGWRERVDDPLVWEAVRRIPDGELWAVRKHLKRRLVAYIRERTRRLWLSDHVHPVQALAAGALLDPYALTIGFARRFATYKRASLILSDFDRLLRLLNRPNTPVQIIFAGKAHPADEPAKRLLQEVYRLAKRAECGGRLVFLEDYDLNLARYLVQGVDVWLNTPLPRQEASGTSGQKAALNGGLNLSALDGWWREGYNGHNGWAIGEDGLTAPEAPPAAEAAGLYELLENEIVPLYYKRSAENVPGEWVARIKESIRTLAPHFSTQRMLKDYLRELYLPAMQMAGGAEPLPVSSSNPS
ncbi:MAG: alpha-glucan phosphorylase [Chloroflexi bacterium RBG_16_64_43]|nr:MAG: alpha-glucan phosphorylase [Chloroflexi bacterium RBG_16_64_43]